jgi:hypothetical protein
MQFSAEQFLVMLVKAYGGTLVLDIADLKEYSPADAVYITALGDSIELKYRNNTVLEQ